jgi:hypothetical protein
LRNWCWTCWVKEDKDAIKIDKCMGQSPIFLISGLVKRSNDHSKV